MVKNIVPFDLRLDPQAEREVLIRDAILSTQARALRHVTLVPEL